VSYLCTRPDLLGNPFPFITDHDRTGGDTFCRPLAEAYDVLEAIYHVDKILKRARKAL
jgi:hypothetical protein